MSSRQKRKSSRWKRHEVVAENFKKLTAAIMKLGTSIVAYFTNAARALRVSESRARREALKFLRISREGLSRHRGYQVPDWALAFLEQVQATTPVAA